jgi:methylthioribose-1-phosphate isomerase
VINPVSWEQGAVVIIDQLRLPGRLAYRRCRTVEDVARAIETLAVRGAPLIGIAAAYGAALGVAGSGRDRIGRDFAAASARLARTRPTAVNLFRALDRMGRTFRNGLQRCPDIAAVKRLLLEEARRIHREDADACRQIGCHGARLIRKRSNVLTHCNAGMLATGGIGTALGVIYAARRQGRIGMVYVNETRPLLQGARLTTWELLKNRVPATLICDNMAGSLMAQGKIDAVIIGADRIAANGDAANKTGSYGLAALATHHDLPVYVAAPISTFDFSLQSGKEIPIEIRNGDEIRKLNGTLVSPHTVNTFNPSFDVVPREYISAIITEHGIIHHPNARKLLPLKKLLNNVKVID